MSSLSGRMQLEAKQYVALVSKLVNVIWKENLSDKIYETVNKLG